jgi:methionyl-tRNA synthetase
MFYNRPEKSDVTFTWADFQEKVNGELIGNLSNLVNRTLTFVKRFYEDGALFSAPIDTELHAQIVEREKKIDSCMERAEERDALRQIISLSSLGNKAFQDGEPWKMRKEQPGKAMSLLKTLVYLIRDLAVMVQPFMPDTSLKMLSFLGVEKTNWKDLGNWEGIQGIGEVSLLFTKLEDSVVEQLRTRFSGSQEEREQKKTKELEKDMDQKEDQVSLAGQFASRVILKVAKITNVKRHPRGDKLYILTLDVQEDEPRTIVSSIVPYYTEEELQDQNIVLVSNLKPANFRGEKSYGMLLAASDPDAEEHTTCEVLFAPQFEVGSVLTPEGFSPVEEKLPYVKADHFFSMPIYTESGVVKIDGKPIGKDGIVLTAKKYLNGPVG